jgi:hypothetical protein
MGGQRLEVAGGRLAALADPLSAISEAAVPESAVTNRAAAANLERPGVLMHIA